MRSTKRTFNLILTLAVMLTMAQTAMAATEEVTETWTMNGSACSISGSTLSNGAGNRMVLNNNMTWTQFSRYSSIDTSQKGLVTNSYNTEISFPDIEGTVTKVELKNFFLGDVGLVLYAGTSMSSLFNKSTGGTAYPSWDDFSYSGDVTYTGTMDVTSSSPLKLMFRAASSTIPDLQIFEFSGGYIKVTYEKEVAADPQHTFSFPNPSSFSGNTLTVTCTNNGAGHECTLTNRQATLTLTAHDNTIESFSLDNPSLNLLDFNNLTGLGATAGSITYTNKTTGNSTTGMIFETGEYTASVTVTVGGNNYTLTKDFSILAGYRVNNNYSQFSVSKVSALEGETMSITYTQQMDESLKGLTLTGATSGNSIAYTQSGNTYTFNMPAEDVNLSATFTYPLNENNITQSGDTYTIKTAEGWDYFCRRMEVDDDLNGFSGKTIKLADNISVTTMAGSGKYPFKGTFDGDGHTLTFNYIATAFYSAPFQKTNGTTIRNLHTTGSIQAGDFQNCGGLVGSAEGNLTIENCRVSAQISSTINGEAGHGGFVGLLSSQYNQCHITGCVFDGLICNPNTWNQTYGCGGFIGAMSQYAYVDLTDCLFLHGQYDNNGNKCELWWGYDNDKNSTFFHRSNGYGEGKLTNCFYVGTRGLKQGSPAVESTDAPDNFVHFGTPTDHGFLKVYGHTMVFDGKYYTPTYGDLVETYSYSGEKSYIIEYDDMPLGIKDVKTKQRTNYLRYNRPFTKDKTVTIMLPFDFTKNDIRRGEYDNILEGKFYEFAGMNGSTPVMEDANEVTEMKANTPYLFMPGENTNYLYFTNGDDYYQGFDIFTEGYERGTKEAAYDALKLIGTYSGKTWDTAESETYILNDFGELEAVTDGTMVKPTSAYVITRNFLELANGADNSDDIETAAESGKAYEGVKLTGRTLFKDGTWNTLCLPFSLSAAQIAANANFAGATLMTMDVTKKNGFDTTDGTLYLWFKTATEIEAGVPYLVKWEKATDYDNNPSAYDISNPVFEGVTVSRTEAQTVESETTGLETVQMVGTYSPVSVTADDKSILFLGDANTLYYSTVDRQIRSCRAYFSVPYINGHAGAKARAFALSFDGEVTTGIIEVSANYNGVTDDAWYSLDGVRLSGKPTQRGMYINKGKKIIVK